jgi:hypothetical protein
MKRRAFNILAAGSLVMCVATVAMWLRSQFSTDQCRYVAILGQVLEVFPDLGDRAESGGLGIWWHKLGPSGGTYWDCRFHSELGMVGIEVNRSEQAGNNSFCGGPLGWHAIKSDYGPANALPAHHHPWWHLGFLVRWHSQKSLYSRDQWCHVTVPYWAITLATALLPGLRAFRERRRQGRARAGLCPLCHYDLRATPDRCPECGTTVPGGHVPKVSR